ncbi:hypothetical protein [Variovorax sp. J22R115]|uniref:nSTAND1 domain-containing NTPase n=1 Tax=Variovorax sp. J22R115 TaxID=3053509 RepID=UPI00257819C1|nr:hypothetical protein [Variovorax sp. J22R115]MDM0053545.1 hypothetical protein [Variovorax sp. J22R115]
MKPEPAHHLEAPPVAAPAGIETEVALSAECPWPGMRPYREQDAGFYFGRGADVEDLLARTERSLLTLLYARGGLGKTSLVRAGLAPRLVERGYLPVYLRPRGLLDGGRDAVAEAIRAVEAAARAGALEATADFDAPSLWELFHREAFDLWDARNRLVSPVLVFDQFEEIFQIIDDDPAAAPRVRALLDAIAELVENRRLAGAEPAEGARFDTTAKDYRVVLSFREDYLPQVRKLRAIVPSVIENHVRLEPMSGKQALEVVEGAGRDLIDRDAATLLVKSVGRPAGLLQRLLDPEAGVTSGGEVINVEVEPSILSVVCFHLNSERQQRGQSTIDVGLVKAKTAEDIFDDYYRSSVAKVSTGTRDFVESSLVTQGGERVLYPMRALEEHGPVLVREVSSLLEQGIVRKEWFAGEQRLEISHDLLLRPIRRAIESNRQQAGRTRDQRRVLLGVSAVLLVAGGVVAWTLMQARLAAEADQRENIAEELLVAYVPLTEDSVDPERLRTKMVELIAAVDATADRGESARRLEQLYDWALRVSNSAGEGNARRLRAFSVDYLQLKIDRGRYPPDEFASLVQKLRAAAGQSCAQGLLLPEDRAVEWFAKRGGLPPECR